MSIITKASAKSYFVTGAFPTQSNFADTIDSYLGLGEAGPQTVSGRVDFPNGITVSGAVAGTVTSVTFTGDNVLLSNTPSTAVTSAGTLTATLKTQTRNTVLAGPSSGSNANPTFRGLVIADIPAMTALGVGALIIAQYTAASTLAAGATTAAANLAVVEFFPSGSTIINPTSDPISGTWQAMQTTAQNFCGFFQRTV